jgi:hypothetical protein
MIKIYGTFLTKKANIKFKAASTVIIHFSLRNTPLSPRRKKIIPMRTAKIVGFQMPKILIKEEGCSMPGIKIRITEKAKLKRE